MAGRRHLTFSAHVGVEFLVGVALGVAPFIFDFDDGATIASLALGVVIATAAISTSVAGHAISAHHAWDRGLVVLLVTVAVVSAIADIGIDTAVFAAGALVEWALLAITRYVPERA